MQQFNVGDTAWFIVRNSNNDGWSAVQRKIVRILGDTEPLYHGGNDIAVTRDYLCGSAAEAFMWISKH